MAPTDPRTLRTDVASRLAVATVVLAAVAGGAAYLKAQRDVDARALELALEQSHSLLRHLDFLAEPDPTRYERLRQAVAAHVLAEHLRNDHFVSIELYDAERRNVLDATDPAHADVYAAIESSAHGARLGPAPSCRRVVVGGVTYLQVFAPLRAGDRTLAFFDGIYALSPETLARLDRGVAELVLAVVGAILATALVLYPVIVGLHGNLLGASEEVAHANMALLAALGSAVAKRDRDTNIHNYRVTIYAIRLAVAVRLTRDQIRALVKGAFLHDVGKIAVADAILRKPGPLTADERTAMQAHVAHGVEILGGAPWLQDAADVVRFHHEKVDGTGYPAGLRGDEIPVVARVFAIVDVFDALTSRRAFKAPAAVDAALATLERGRGTSFDPALLDAFLALAPDLHRRFSARSELELVRVLDALLVEYFGVGASAAAARTLGVCALGVERPGPEPRAAIH